MQTAEALSTWTRSPFAIVDHVDPIVLGSEGPVRYLVVRGAREGASLGVIGAIWVSTDGRRGGVVPHPDGAWSAAELVRNHTSALERGWSPTRIFDYWRATDDAWGLDIEPSLDAGTLHDVAERVLAS